MIPQLAPSRVLLVDDDDDLREASVQSMEMAGLTVVPFAAAKPALAMLTEDFDGVLVSDVRMPGLDGLQLFEIVRDIDREIPVILITGHGDVSMAVQALQNGAFDFLAKPFANEQLVRAIIRAQEIRRLVLDNRRLKAAVGATDSPLIGGSAVMTRLRETIAQVGRAEVDVLIEGETGTGKELVAKLLTRSSPRAGRPFIAVNCAALPEIYAEAELFGHDELNQHASRAPRIGRIEASSGGTLFLDEIDGMPLALQAHLLRVLEEREILPIGAKQPKHLDLRVIAAAKRPLPQLVEQGAFRSDLLYRLNVVMLTIPPLRERREDIPELFGEFVDDALRHMGQKSFKMTQSVRDRLLNHDWPGNVRELRNFAFNAVLGLIPQDQGQNEPDTDDSLAEKMARYEELLIRDALQAANGSVTRTCEALGLPRKTFYDKCQRAGIAPSSYRRTAPK